MTSRPAVSISRGVLAGREGGEGEGGPGGGRQSPVRRRKERSAGLELLFVLAVFLPLILKFKRRNSGTKFTNGRCDSGARFTILSEVSLDREIYVWPGRTCN